MSQLKRSHARKSTLLSSIDDFELRCSLGKGSMGKVKLGVHNVTGQKVAVKIVKRANFQINGYNNLGRPLTKEQQMKAKSKEETRELRTIREAHIMMLLRHPNIVQLKNLVAVGPFFYIIMDYVNGGQLLHYIVKQHKLSEAHARHFTRQIVSALDYLHRNSIVHRDLKIENILIDKEGQNIKIIDFGLSNLFCPEKRLTTYCGSLYFAAPELLHATPYRGPEIDVWSLGVVIYVMVTGSVPFDDKCMPGLHEKIKRGQVAYPAHLSPACRDLLSHIFVTNPSKRIILADIIRHHWVNEGYTRPIKNHLPPRAPIMAPLSPTVLQHMTRGFNMGSIEDIQIKMEMIVSSAVYRSAADYVVQIQQSAALTTKELMKQPYDDPQTVPAAYHPLLSIYHLTQERLLDQENGTDNLLQNDLHLSSHDHTQEPLTPSPFPDSTSFGSLYHHTRSFVTQTTDTSSSSSSVHRRRYHLQSSSTTSPSSSSSLEKITNKLPEKQKQEPAPARFNFTNIFHRSTSSLAAVFAKVLCTR